MMQVEEEIRDIIEKATSGKRISKEEAYELGISSSLLSIGNAANRLREKRCGDAVSYVVNRNINFTNICQGSCKFCAFGVGKGSKDAYLLSHRTITKMVEDAKKSGATEVCIQGGLNPEVDIYYYLEMLDSIKSKHDIHIHAFSPMEVFYIAEKSGLGIKETILALKEKGLDSMPGTAAEIFDREIREIICPNKISAAEWKKVIETAHILGVPTTATMLYGHIERIEHRINHLDMLRKIQDKTGGFTEFVPLSFIHHNSPLKDSDPEVRGASGVDDLKTYALSRLFLDNFKNLQASWVKLGVKLAQVTLFYGANDFGGTLMDEKISRAAGGHVDTFDEKTMRALIEQVGRSPIKRDTLYNPA